MYSKSWFRENKFYKLKTSQDLDKISNWNLSIKEEHCKKLLLEKRCNHLQKPHRIFDVFQSFQGKRGDLETSTMGEK